MTTSPATTPAPRLFQVDADARVAVGGKSDLFDIGGGEVLKLYHSRFSLETASKEFDLTRAAARAGLPVWTVGGLGEADGRFGLTGGFVAGIDVSALMRRRPWRLFALLRLLAGIQAGFHAAQVATEIPARQMSLGHAIEVLGRLDPPFAALVGGILRAERPLGFCHGDFHGANVHLVDGRPVVLDLERAGRGETALDVARCLSWLMFGDGDDHRAGLPERAFRFWLVEIYLSHYCGVSATRPTPILAWLIAEICRRRRAVRDDRVAAWHLGRLRRWLLRLEGRNKAA